MWTMHARPTKGEKTSLLDHQDTFRTEDSPRTVSYRDLDFDGERPARVSLWRRLVDFAIGFALCAVLAFWMTSSLHTHAEVPSSQDTTLHKKHGSLRADDDKKKSSTYTRFQAMGFQIYTGGAPAVIVQPDGPTVDGHPTLVPNPECKGLNSWGHFDDWDTPNGTLPSSLWQCYLGHTDPMKDIQRRLEIMTQAVERAHQLSTDDPSVLKIFIAPEFYWRGREGAYVFQPNKNPMLEEDACTEVCQIMLGLEQLVSQKKYQDWLFLFGTIVASESLPQHKEEDNLFYNFAPVYKGYDPATQDHGGKRFLVPKRYVSNVDFLTPLRQYNGTLTKELVDLNQEQAVLAGKRSGEDDDYVNVKPSQEGNEPVVVENPFELQRNLYDRDMWYTYKDELTNMGYHMIEYDWLILDNITFSIEVCLDHDLRTALNTYLADNVLGSPSRIPMSVEDWDPVAQKLVGGVEKVSIPRHQAQISLVSSMGMTANPQSLALANNGTLILQDGASSENGTMAWVADCDRKSWHFDGGSEFISRTASLTDTKLGFEYQIQAPNTLVGVYDDEKSWKGAMHGVFSAMKYEPMIRLYPVRQIANV